jgi:hypothetical protein
MLLSPKEVIDRRMGHQYRKQRSILHKLTERVNAYLCTDTIPLDSVEVPIDDNELHLVEEIIANLREKGWDAQYTNMHGVLHNLIIKVHKETVQ